MDEGLKLAKKGFDDWVKMEIRELRNRLARAKKELREAGEMNNKTSPAFLLAFVLVITTT